MLLPDLLAQLRRNRDFMSQVIAWERFPAAQPRYLPLTHPLEPALVAALESRGVDSLFSHQAAAISAALNGENVVIATPTASGKSLCYTVPVLERLLQRPSAQALYLFPTKALSHDQLAETNSLIATGDLPVRAIGYDGDTPQHKRRKARKNGWRIGHQSRYAPRWHLALPSKLAATV